MSIHRRSARPKLEGTRGRKREYMERGTVGQAGPERFRACDALYAQCVGQANSKPRKAKKKPQHLNKVGAAEDMRTEGARERGAIMDVMGLGNMSSGGRSTLFVVGVLILVAAIVALVVLTALP